MNRREFTKSVAALVAGYASHWPAGSQSSTLLANGDTFNVRDFGALGNGSSDDTKPFQLALARAARRGGTVLVPAGRFPVLSSLHLSDGVTLRGVGAESVIYRPSGEPIVVVCVHTRKAGVQDLAFSGKFSFAVLIEQSTEISVAGCHISGGTIRWLSSGYCGGIFVTQSNDITLAGNELSGNGHIGDGVLSSDIQINGFGDKVYSRGIRILRNQCASTETQCCIAAYDLQRSEISDNACSGAKTGPGNNNGYGIMIYQRAGSPGSCTRNRMARNRVSKTQGSAIYLQRCHHSQVIENTVSDAADIQTDQTLPVAGIALNRSEYVSVKDNRISRVGRAGISIASDTPGVGHVQVVHNDISDVNGVGIQLRGLLTDIRVERNTVTKTRGGIGSITDDAQDNIVLSDNDVSATSGSSAGIILGNAGKSIVRGNRVTDSGGYGLALTLRDTASVVEGNTVQRSGRAFGGKYPDVRISRGRDAADPNQH